MASTPDDGDVQLLGLRLLSLSLGAAAGKADDGR